MGMLSDGLSWLATALNTAAGEEATLTRGAQTTTLTVVSQGDGGDGEYATSLGSTPEETVFVQYPPEHGYCGFVVKTADYAIGGAAVLPQLGDKLTIAGRVFELSAPAGAEPWKYHPNPQYRTWLWLHTKLVT